MSHVSALQLCVDRIAGTIDDADLEDAMADLRIQIESDLELDPDTLDANVLAHRGEPYRADQFRPFPNTPEGNEAAQKVITSIQAGTDPVTGAQHFTRGERRLPPRAGLKTWRLRGLKRALREAADRGMNDLYLPTG